MAAQGRPERIGAYVMESEIGRGADGVVYRAHHRNRPDTPVALKVVEGRGNLDRLLIEPAVLSRLDHPGIVGLKDYFVQGDDLVLALDFVKGEDLKSLLDGGATFEPEEVRDLVVQLAGALAEAHAKDVIHRDVKPSNILVVTEAGRRRFVLTDFGIGQVAEGIQVKKHTGGTFHFMAPEQLRGRPGPQSDLWALGVVAYRLLAGRLPFVGPTLGELARQILYETPVPPSHFSSAPIDPELEGVVLRLLDKSLQERIASADEILSELGQGRRKAPRASAQVAGRVLKTSLDRSLQRGIKRRRILIVVCVLAYLLPSGFISAGLLLAGMILFARGQREERGSRHAYFVTGFAFVLMLGHIIFRFFLAEYDPGLGWLVGLQVTRSSGLAFMQS